MKSPILGSSYVARSVNAADNRMVNLFPEMIPEGGKEPAFLQRAPGLSVITLVGNGGALGNIATRGMWEVYNSVSASSSTYVVNGTALYDISSPLTSLGTVAGSGLVSMADNGTQLFIATSTGVSYIYNTVTGAFAQITDPDFPGATSVTYLDGFFVFCTGADQKVWVTALLNGLSVDATHFASAEASPDLAIAVIANHSELWVFGTNSVEVWYNAGNAGFPFQRIQGAYLETGCSAAPTVAKLGNTLFWLGVDRRGRGVVYKANGYTPERISTPAVEWVIQNNTLNLAFAYTYTQAGHDFYVITFPGDDETWVYDLTTGVWHERASWNGSVFLRHRSICAAFASIYNSIIVGDHTTNQIYLLALHYYKDDNGALGSSQKWLRSWRALPTGMNNLKRTAHHSLQLDCETGNGIDGASSTAPTVTLRFSDDGGHTWSNNNTRTMGASGEYGTRVIWRRLGMTMKLRDRVYEVSGTDATPIFINGAELILSPTDA